VKFFIFLYYFEKEVTKDKVGSVRVQELSKNLIRFKQKVVLFIPKTNNPYRLAQESLKIVEIPFLPFWLLRPITFYTLLFLISFWQALRLRPDIIYVRIMGTFFPVILSRLLRIPLVIEVNGDSIGGYKNKFKIACLTFIDRINFKFCDKAIPITKSLQAMLEKRYRVPLAKTVVLSSGSNISLFRPMDSTLCRQRIKVVMDLFYVGFIGTLYKYQGIATLIDAAREVLNSFPKTKFLIVGDGPMKESLIQKAADEKLSEYFIFTGQVPYEEAPYYINAMDVCVAPLRGDRGEASPVKIFDYWACGKPVVASNIQTVSDIVTETKGGILVTPENPAKLSAAIVRLLANEKERYEFGRNGRTLMVEKYSWEKITQETVRVCEEVISGRKATRNAAI